MIRQAARRGRRSRPKRTAFRRLLDLGLALAILAALAVVAARGPFGPAVEPAGNAMVVDGDSLEIGAIRIRLEGIDAPELSQTCRKEGEEYACGREARRQLVTLIGGDAVTCQGWRHDRYDRLLATCVARGAELNRAMVEQGWAVDFGGYAGEERLARDAGRGLWAGTFDDPQAWRRERGDPREAGHGWWPDLLERLRSLFAGSTMDTQTEGETTG